MEKALVLTGSDADLLSRTLEAVKAKTLAESGVSGVLQS
jgi:hypothetical protein